VSYPRSAATVIVWTIPILLLQLVIAFLLVYVQQGRALILIQGSGPERFALFAVVTTAATIQTAIYAQFIAFKKVPRTAETLNGLGAE
jgi:hypothetical protein